VIPDAICEEVERLRPEFPPLERVDIWVADTATFGAEKDYLEFQRREGRAMVESFTFFKDVLIGMSRNGMPLPMRRHDVRWCATTGMETMSAGSGNHPCATGMGVMATHRPMLFEPTRGAYDVTAT
jgi:hypothetical protein